MKKLLAILLGLSFATHVYAAAFTIQQVINPVTDGFVYSNGTALSTLVASSAPSFLNFSFGKATGTQATTTSFAISSILSKLLKTNSTGGVIAAVGDTDFQNPISLTTTGISGAATFIGDVLNIPQYSGGTGSGSTATSTVDWIVYNKGGDFKTYVYDTISGADVYSNGTFDGAMNYIINTATSTNPARTNVAVRDGNYACNSTITYKGNGTRFNPHFRFEGGYGTSTVVLVQTPACWNLMDQSELDLLGFAPAFTANADDWAISSSSAGTIQSSVRDSNFDNIGFSTTTGHTGYVYDFAEDFRNNYYGHGTMADQVGNFWRTTNNYTNAQFINGDSHFIGFNFCEVNNSSSGKCFEVNGNKGLVNQLVFDDINGISNDSGSGANDIFFKIGGTQGGSRILAEGLNIEQFATSTQILAGNGIYFVSTKYITPTTNDAKAAVFETSSTAFNTAFACKEVELSASTFVLYDKNTLAGQPTTLQGVDGANCIISDNGGTAKYATTTVSVVRDVYNNITGDGSLANFKVLGDRLVGNATAGMNSFIKWTTTGWQTFFGGSQIVNVDGNGQTVTGYATSTNVVDTTLATAAGTYVAADPTGKLIATTTPTGGSASSTLLADNNTFSGTNQFNKLTFTNATGTAATTTSLFSTTGTFTNFFGASLTSCNGASNALTWSAGQFGCNTISSGGSGTDVNWSFFNGSGIHPATTTNQVLVGASSTSTLSKLEVVGGATFDTSTSTSATTTNFSTTLATFGSNTISTIITNGNFGYGTSTPRTPVAISTSTNAVLPYITINNTGAFSAGGGAIDWYNSGTGGNLTTGRISSTPGNSFTDSSLVFSVANTSKVLTEQGRFTTTGFQVTGSTTLQNFTGLNSTTTNATTTSLAISSIASKILKTNSTGTVAGAVGDTDYQNPITLTTTGSSGAATFIGDTLNIPQYSGGSGASSTLYADNGTFSGANSFTGLTTLSTTLHTGSTTLQNFTGVNATVTSATTTNFAISSIASKLLQTNANGTVSGYGGTTCTNQFVRSLSALGIATCATVANTDLANSSITVNSTNIALGASGTITAASSTILTDNNAFTGKDTFTDATITRSTTTAATTTTAYVSGTLTVGPGTGAIIGTNGQIVNNQNGSAGLILHNSSAGNETGLFAGGTNGSVGSITNNTFHILQNNLPAMYFAPGGFQGIGTSTPQWQLELASSTRGQLALSDGTLTSNQWVFRSAGNILYIATSSPSTFATSSVAALTIDANGKVKANCFTTDGSTCITGGSSAYDFPLTGNATSTLTQFNGGLTAFASSTIGNGTVTGGLTVNGTASTTNLIVTGNATSSQFNLTGTNLGGLNSIYSGATNQIDFNTNGVWRGGFTSTGQFTVGTTTPTWTLTAASAAPVFELDDTDGATNAKHLIMSFNSGVFAIGTSSDSTLTSTSTALTVTPGVGSQLGVGTTSPWRTLSVVGSMAITGLTASTAGTPVCILSNFEVVSSGGTTCALSSKFTKDILGGITSEQADNFVLNSNPIVYRNKDDGIVHYGFVAEEMDKIDPVMTVYEKATTTLDGHTFNTGDPLSIDYDKGVAAIVKYLQDHATQAKRSVEENYQWLAIAVLFGIVLWQGRAIRKLSK